MIYKEVIFKDLDAWRETIEIMSDKKLMAQIKQADTDWVSGKKRAYTAWTDLKRVK